MRRGIWFGLESFVHPREGLGPARGEVSWSLEADACASRSHARDEVRFVRAQSKLHTDRGSGESQIGGHLERNWSWSL